MLESSIFFDDNVINIFTDASIISKKEDFNYYIGCAGIAAYRGTTMIKSCSPIITNSTNNESEIYGILCGIKDAIQMKYLYDPKRINLFSDSIISIKGLREWYKTWLSTEQDGIIYSTSGAVKNQNYFIYCMAYIISCDLEINLYHVRGHTDPNNFLQRRKFMNSFLKENKQSYSSMDERLISFLIEGNRFVDEISRSALTNIPKEVFDKYYDSYKKNYQQETRIFNLHDLICNLDIEKYEKLIGGFNIYE